MRQNGDSDGVTQILGQDMPLRKCIGCWLRDPAEQPTPDLFSAGSVRNASPPPKPRPTEVLEQNPHRLVAHLTY